MPSRSVAGDVGGDCGRLVVVDTQLKRGIVYLARTLQPTQVPKVASSRGGCYYRRTDHMQLE